MEKSSRYRSTKRTVKVAAAAAVFGAAIGATLGMLNAPKKGKEITKDLEREAKLLWSKMNKSKKEINTLIEKTFGELSPETIAMYAKAKTQIMARVIKYRSELNKKKYDQIVDSVMKNLTKSKTRQKQLVQLKKEFKKTWRDLKDII